MKKFSKKDAELFGSLCLMFLLGILVGFTTSSPVPVQSAVEPITLIKEITRPVYVDRPVYITNLIKEYVPLVKEVVKYVPSETIQYVDRMVEVPVTVTTTIFIAPANDPPVQTVEITKPPVTITEPAIIITEPPIIITTEAPPITITEPRDFPPGPPFTPPGQLKKEGK